MTVLKAARGISLLFTGLFAGFLVGVLVLEISLRGYGAAVYTQVRRVELDSLDTLASVTLIPALIATVVVAIRARGNDRRLVLLAVALLGVVLITSFVVNLPINADQSDWSIQTPPADWATVRDRWQLAHAVRTGAALLAFGSLIAATLTRRALAKHPAPPTAVPA